MINITFTTKLQGKRKYKRAAKQLDECLLASIGALHRAAGELDIVCRAKKIVVRTELPTSEGGRSQRTEETTEPFYERGRIDLSALRTLVSVLGELRSMLDGLSGAEAVGGVVILPGRLAAKAASDADGEEKE